MPVGFPTKVNYATGDVLSATNMNDLSGTVNLLESAQYAAGKNAVINGGFDIWQRGTSIALGTTQAYTADRWYSYRGGVVTGCTVSRQTSSLTGIQYCARVARTAGDTSTQVLTLQYNAETADSYRFAGQNATISFYVRAGANFSAAGNTLSYSLQSGTGTDQTLANGLTGQTAILPGASTTLTTSWQRVTATGAIASTATQVAMSFTYTPTGTAGANDYFEITGVQLEVGSTASPFRRSAGNLQGELAACQRYYYRINADAQSIYAIFGQGSATSTTIAYCQTPFPVQMRVKPTAIDYPTVSTYFQCLDATAGGSTMTALTFDANQTTSTMGFLTATVPSGLTQFRPYVIRGFNSTAAYLGWSSEL